MPQELTIKETLVLIISQSRTVYVAGPAPQQHWLGYLTVNEETYRVIGRASGMEARRFTLADVKCASLRGEEFAVIELKGDEPAVVEVS
jgi:hypothetical protein